MCRATANEPVRFHCRTSLIWRPGLRAASFALQPSARVTLTTIIYGIKNCDTMKKARAWLDSHGVGYDFHDYKTAAISKEKLKRWSDRVGWETLLDRAGTTFRKLPEA